MEKLKIKKLNCLEDRDNYYWKACYENGKWRGKDNKLFSKYLEEL